MTEVFDKVNEGFIKTSILSVYTKHFKQPYAKNADKIDIEVLANYDESQLREVYIHDLEIAAIKDTTMYTTAKCGKFSNFFRPKKFQKTELFKFIDLMVNDEEVPVAFPDVLLFGADSTIMCVRNVDSYEGIGGLFVRTRDTKLSTLENDGLAIEPLRNYLEYTYPQIELD